MRKVLLLSSLFIFLFLVGTLAAVFIVQESYVATADTSGDNSAPYFWLGQKFRVGANGLAQNFTLTMVTVWLNISDPTANYTILIQNNTGASDTPNGQNVSRGTIYTGLVVNSGLRPFNITMIPGTLYAHNNYTLIVFSNKTHGDVFSGVGRVTTNPSYGGGNGTNSTNSGGTWQVQPWDIPFILYSGVEVIANATNFANDTTYETASTYISSNITLNQNYNISSATLNYAGTTYTASVTQTSPLNYTLSATAQVPTGLGAKEWFWTLTFTNGTSYALQGNLQGALLTNLSICGSAPQDTNYYNITFKNETPAQETVKATISAVINYWLGDGTFKKTLTYSSSTEQFSYSFCLTPNTTAVTIEPTITYDNSESEPRIFSSEGFAINPGTTKTLFLLPSSSGIFVTFQVVNPALQPISGATVTISRTGFGDVASGTTDSSGSVTFFLNPFITYTVTASASGYPTLSQSITPSQTQYTITLGGATNSSYPDASQGINYLIGPQLSYLNNNTQYTFNLSINSSVDLDLWGYVITNGTTSLATQSSTSEIGTLSSVLNTQNYSFVRMNYFWVIDGQYVNGSRTWVIESGDNSGWSIKNLFTYIALILQPDPTTGRGVFGMNQFGFSLLIFLAIFIFTGIMSYQFSITSPAALSAMIFGMVALFDVGLGLIYNPIGAIAHFPTFFMALIAIAIAIREGI